MPMVLFLPRWLLATVLIQAVAAGAAMPADAGPLPGIVNATLGDVKVDGVPVTGAVAREPAAHAGRVVRTGQGMAEVLLNPGAFLRLGERSELTVETTGTQSIRIRLGSGEALIELLQTSRVVVEQDGASAVIQKPGLYGFNKKSAAMSVYAGEIQCTVQGRQTAVGSGFALNIRNFREFRMNPGPGSDLFSWSSSRSRQLSAGSALVAQAQASEAGRVRTAGWYWDAWSASWTFLSASGFVAGPFGWPYFSPGYAPQSLPSVLQGESGFFGRPALPSAAQLPDAGRSESAPPLTPAVPLTAPGEPRFPNSRF